MPKELETSIIAEINREHQNVVLGAKKTASSILDTINSAIRCGILLQKAKQDCRESKGHGHWLIWIKTNLSCSESTVLRYIALSKAYPSPVTDLKQGVYCLKDLMIESGVLPAPQGHGEQKRHVPDSFYSRVCLGVSKFFEPINKEVKSRPIDLWEPAERVNVKRQLQPIVDIYEKL